MKDDKILTGLIILLKFTLNTIGVLVLWNFFLHPVLGFPIIGFIRASVVALSVFIFRIRINLKS